MTIFWFLCVVIYLISIFEIIGSSILSRIKQNGLHTHNWFTIFPIIFPPLAPIVAFDIYSDAVYCYDHKKDHSKVYYESLICYLTHGCLGIKEYVEKNKKKEVVKHDKIQK